MPLYAENCVVEALAWNCCSAVHVFATEREAPLLTPQSEAVPVTTPEESTCRHCVEPLMPEMMRLVVLAVPKYPVPETVSAVDEANDAVSLVPLKFRKELSSVKRVPSKYGIELVCQVVVPVPPLPVVSAVARVRTPAESNVDVAVPPKYEGPYEERSDVEAFAN